MNDIRLTPLHPTPAMIEEGAKSRFVLSRNPLLMIPRVNGLIIAFETLEQEDGEREEDGEPNGCN